MTRSVLALVVIVLALAAPRSARADGDDTEALTAQQFDPSTCGVAPPAPAAGAANSVPVTWSGFEIEGQLADNDQAKVRALFEPTMARHRALTEDARGDIEKIATAFGYHVVGISTKTAPAGTLAVIHLSLLPMVRRINVAVKQKFVDTFNNPLLDDEIKRRIRLRVGSYLPWTPHDRACAVFDERRRVEEYLRDEGFFDATVEAWETVAGRGATIHIKVHLGEDYSVEEKSVRILAHDPFPDLVTDKTIEEMFRHRCHVYKLCLSFTEKFLRFRRTQLAQDVQDVIKLFHKKGYPAVRVRTDFDPLTSFDRRTKTVRFAVTIDLRRKLDVKFEGIDPDGPIKISELEDQLTFNQAASSDDVETAASTRALTAFLQDRGYFDAKVTSQRETFERPPLDQIIFRIEMGKSRKVANVEFTGNHAFKDDDLFDAIGTHAASTTGTLFGASAHATADQLAADVDALARMYRQAGYREVRVSVAAATDQAGLQSAALAAGLAALDHGSDLFVRFRIDEGTPTLLSQIQVVLGPDGDAVTTPEQKTLCKQVLTDLARLYTTPALATPVTSGRCIAIAPDMKFQEQIAQDNRDRLRDRLFSRGRPKARVDYESRALGPHRVAVTYKLSDVQPLTIGKVIIRGNFHTGDATIRQLLKLDEGKPLTKDALAEGARRVRNSGLFDSVNVAMPDLDNVSEGSVNAVVEVAERYDYGAQVDVEAGYSSYNGTFVTLNPGLRNWFGLGIALDLKGTVGVDSAELFDGNFKLKQLSAEAQLRLPDFLIERVIGPRVQGELDAFTRRQDTPRFGLLTTNGVTVSATRTWNTPRTPRHPAHAFTFGPHYDFRLRDRSVDVLRPVGADDDESQVPVSTRTGSIGISAEYEHRNDRNGALSPLAPEAGYRVAAQASIAATWLGGQDNFAKVSTAGTYYRPVGGHFVLRGDLRYDQGFPLGGAVLLPEVERFFAGGDSTVRGYEDDRLATEIIQVGVPPLGNVSQIRILPAGGNIRVMGSLDAELRIWKLFATGAFIDAGLITNQWQNTAVDDIRPSVGVALVRIVTPFGSLAIERAIPLRPQLGDNPRGRFHVSFAARAQF